MNLTTATKLVQSSSEPGQPTSKNGHIQTGSKNQLTRTTFRTSRKLDFFSQKELVAQTGHRVEDWPLVVLKELMDNAIDACEDAGIASEIAVQVDHTGIAVADNGPGIPVETIEGVLDFDVRVSSRECYVSPTRGAQGNALKTVVSMPFVLDGETGRVDVAAHGLRHEIGIAVDRLRQEPVIDRRQQPDENVKTGTIVHVHWPSSACSILQEAEARFLQIADDYLFLNPHLTLTVDWFGQRTYAAASDPAWSKWLSRNPTCPHWYAQEHFDRLISAYIAHDADRGVDRTVREFVREFGGLTGTAKQKAVLDATGLARVSLAGLTDREGLNHEVTAKLLNTMKDHTKPVKPAALGVIGKKHLEGRFEALGCEMKTFDYRKAAGATDGLPWVIETAFGWCPNAKARRLVTGVNWSPGILNPFRQIGKFGKSLDEVLARQRSGRSEPVILVLHIACPRVEYTDRGKSAVVISGNGSCSEEEA
jgi:DNA topoisomerase VI subunit B